MAAICSLRWLSVSGFRSTDGLKVGYRFLHYSDAGIHGTNSIGADFHMVAFIYRFLSVLSRRLE